MLQTTLKPDVLRDCLWARQARIGTGVVLAVPVPLTYGLAPWLHTQGWHLAGFTQDNGQHVAYLVGGNPNGLLMWLPAPPSRGSQTAGNLLPW